MAFSQVAQPVVVRIALHVWVDKATAVQSYSGHCPRTQFPNAIVHMECLRYFTDYSWV